MQLRISSTSEKKRYPQPKAVGGRLIRQTIQLLRGAGLELPVQQEVWIAVSGGADSVALLALLVRYGRRVVPLERIRILHIHHGWRPKDAALDQKYVEKLAKKWGIPLRVVKLDPSHLKKGSSWEEAARKERLRVFEEVTQMGSYVLTAHHADDLAETVLWRVCTGTFLHQREGIRIFHERQIRPFLTIRKQELREFLREEKLVWREDRTNQDPRFLRAKLRKKVMPALELIFPQMVSHLTQLALSFQKAEGVQTQKPVGSVDIISLLLPLITQTRLKRQHYEWLRSAKGTSSGINLPGGWFLKREKMQQTSQERWVLERVDSLLESK